MTAVIAKPTAAQWEQWDRNMAEAKDSITSDTVGWLMKHDIRIVDRITWPSGIRHVKIEYAGKVYGQNGDSVPHALERLFQHLQLDGLGLAMFRLEHALWLLTKRLPDVL